MIAVLFFGAVAVPLLLAVWAATWLLGDLFGGQATVPVRVRSDRIRR